MSRTVESLFPGVFSPNKITSLTWHILPQTEVMSRQWHQARHERAQEFLDLFVRQNTASLEHITCAEIIPVELDVGHHAVYLELSQHLISQKMQIKKLNNKKNSDRIDRLNASLNTSESAEQALLKTALAFESSSEVSALGLLGRKRLEQRRETAMELKKLMAGFEGLKRTEEISQLYNRYKKDIQLSNWLGDKDASDKARRLLAAAMKAPISGAFSQLVGVSAIKKATESKKLLSELRETSRELALRIRSERFIGAIQALLGPLTGAQEGTNFHCSSPDCNGAARLDQLHLITQCGHTACDDCLSSRTNTEACVQPQCNVAVQGANLVRATNLGSSAGRSRDKLQTITQIISKFPKDDQGLVFAPNDEIVEVLEKVFDQHGIAYHSLRGCKPATTARIVEQFKTHEGPETQGKVLILNLGSEAAAGVNLTNANHIIFVSPLLSKTQYEFDSAMAQAIARSRHYGQTKKVHIYHVIAQRTIDLDILEHRHKRCDAIATSKFSKKLPPTLTKREKSRLIKNKKGQMALVPVSWLADRAARKLLGVDENPEQFTSLINFSEKFEGDD